MSDSAYVTYKILTMGAQKSPYNMRAVRVGESWQLEVKDVIFPKNRYDILHQTHSFHDNKGRYIESSLQPDFKFRDRFTKKEFWVECKYRGSLYNEKVAILKQEQRDRLLKLTDPVFICLALDLPAFDNEQYYLVPFCNMKYDHLFVSVLNNYEIGFGPMVSNILWKLG